MRNRFYISYISDGNGEWMEAQNRPFVDSGVFETVRGVRLKWRPPRQCLVGFLANAADAWRTADPKQRNKLDRVLFERIKLDTGKSGGGETKTRV